MKRFLFQCSQRQLRFQPSPAARTSYAIHTNDGRTIVSDGKPKESDSGLLGYTDANGVKQQINKTDVKEVSEIPH